VVVYVDTTCELTNIGYIVLFFNHAANKENSTELEEVTISASGLVKLLLLTCFKAYLRLMNDRGMFCLPDINNISVTACVISPLSAEFIFSTIN